jgi:hypothetical protein
MKIGITAFPMLLALALFINSSAVAKSEEKFSLEEHNVGIEAKIRKEIDAKNIEPWNFFDISLKAIFKKHEKLQNLEPLHFMGEIGEEATKTHFLGKEPLST